MKKSISLVLCLAMLVSVFSCLGVTASAVDAQDLFTVECSSANDKLTYTVYLNANVKLSGAIVYAKFDDKVLSVDKANTGAYMVDDGDGGERENIGSSMYEADYMAGYTDQYSIAHAYSMDSDYKVGSSKKAFIKFTFNVTDSTRPATQVKFYCYEFNSKSEPKNNIQNGSAELIYSKKVATLGKAQISDATNTKEGIEITWKKVAGAEYYNIYKDGEYLDKTTSTTFLDTAVTHNKTYKYEVRAVNAASSQAAAEKSSAFSIKHLDTPTTLKLTNKDGSIVVSWAAVEGATRYRVYKRIVNADGTVSKWDYITGKIKDVTYTDTVVKSGTKYEYAVRVYSDDYHSDLYGEKAVIYLAAPEFKVDSSVKGVSVTWEKVTGATGYTIYRKVKGGSWKTVTTVSSSKTSYTDTGATSGKTVYYRVKATSGSFASAYDEHSLYYLATPTASVKNTSSGSRVSWGKVAGATSYDVYRKAGSASSWTKIKTTTSTAYTDTKVKSGTTYKYCVRAVNSTTKSKYGSSSYVKIKFLSAPKVEKIKTAKKGVTVYWDDVKGADGYVIYRKTGSGSFKEYATVNGKSTVSYVDKGAKKGKTYTYRIYAKSGSYRSSYKSELKIKDKY